MDVLSAIVYRQCIRAFVDKPVLKAEVDKILNTAKWAPSGVNSQPWRVIVVAGNARQQLCDSILVKFDAKIASNPDYHYYPTEWVEPYKARRKACGLALYSALNIQKGDEVQRRVAWRRNYEFFGAPVGLMFLVEKRLEKGSWLDMGLFLQNVMLAARGIGLETCPQAAMAEYPDVVRDVLKIGPEWAVVCGMALGHADWDHPVNQYRTTREPEAAFAELRGFE